MTKNDFDQKFNEIYKNALTSSFDPDSVKSRLKNFVGENGKVSTEDLCLEFLMLSSEFSKQLTYDILSSVLEFSDSND